MSQKVTDENYAAVDRCPPAVRALDSPRAWSVSGRNIKAQLVAVKKLACFVGTDIADGRMDGR